MPYLGRLLAISLLWKLSWLIVVPLMLVLREEVLKLDIAWVVYVPCPMCTLSSAIGTFLPRLGRPPRAIATVYNVLGVSLITLTNNSKESFHRC